MRSSTFPAIPRRALACPLLLLLLLCGSDAIVQAQERPYLDPDRPWLAEGDSLISVGEAQLALETYRNLLDAHADEVQLWLRLSAVHVALGQSAEGLDAARQARRLDPDGPDPYVMLAQAQFATGDAPTAVTTLEQGVARHPDDIPLLEALATVKIGIGDWGAAAGLLRQLILLDGENPMYYADLGRIQHRAGEMDLAYQSLQRAVELGAPRAETLALLGHACVALGRLEEARTYLEESLELKESAEAWSGMAGVHFLEGDASQAEAAFRRALEINPRDPDAWFNLGIALGVQERPAEAEAAFRRAIEADPGRGSAPARLNLGVMLLSRMAIQEAQEQFQTAIRVNPQLPGPYLHLARIAGANFDYENAKRHYELYGERVPDAQEQARIRAIILDLESRILEKQDAQARGEVHLLQIMTTTREMAEIAHRRVQGGEDFYTVGEESSQLASVTGVDIGFMDPNSLNEEFREAIVALDIGQYTDVLPGPKGWFLFMRVE